MQIVSAFKSVEVFSFLVQSKYETRVIECRVLSRHRLNPSKTSFLLSTIDRFASPTFLSTFVACFFSDSITHLDLQFFLTQYRRFTQSRGPKLRRATCFNNRLELRFTLTTLIDAISETERLTTANNYGRGWTRRGERFHDVCSFTLIPRANSMKFAQFPADTVSDRAF